MGKAKAKWQILKAVLKSDNCILIHQGKNGFEYKSAGDNLMYALLHQRLTQYVPNWHRQWVKKNNALADETD